MKPRKVNNEELWNLIDEMEEELDEQLERIVGQKARIFLSLPIVIVPIFGIFNIIN